MSPELYESSTRRVLTHELADPIATVELVPQQDGVFCGIRDALALLQSQARKAFQISALEEGAPLVVGEVAMRLRGRYLDYAPLANGLAGIVATQSAWATAAHALVTAAAPAPVISAPSLAIVPSQVAAFEHAAKIGGCEPGANLLSRAVVSRALILLMGDTLRAVQAVEQTLATDLPLIVLVDTLYETTDEAVRVALALGDRLEAVVVEIPLVQASDDDRELKRLRDQLDLAGFPRVKIFASGAVTVENISQWNAQNAPLDGYLAGDTIANTTPLAFSLELKESDGKPLARRGSVPGTTPGARLKRMDLE